MTGLLRASYSSVFMQPFTGGYEAITTFLTWKMNKQREPVQPQLFHSHNYITSIERMCVLILTQ